MHSKSNEDYTIHFNSDFSRVLYVNKKTDIERNIPPALFALLYSAIAEDIICKISDTVDNAVWEQCQMQTRLQNDWEAENATD